MSEAVTPTDEFLFTITGVFRIKGRGTVVCGLVDGFHWNRLRPGEIVEVRDGETVVLNTRVVGVEMFMVDPPSTTGRWPVGVLISKESMPTVVEGHTLWKLASHTNEGN
jgi:translation elongation factor EF-Tu-like GTPase